MACEGEANREIQEEGRVPSYLTGAVRRSTEGRLGGRSYVEMSW